jgi:ABC-type amino acid transport substrate-binding protein
MVATSDLARADQPEIIVPNFWDHKAVFDRPNNIPDTIQFLATDNFPPFVFRDPQGRLTGFNIDLSRALCQELAISCALKIKDFEVSDPGLGGGRGRRNHLRPFPVFAAGPRSDIHRRLHETAGPCDRFKLSG